MKIGKPVNNSIFYPMYVGISINNSIWDALYSSVRDSVCISAWDLVNNNIENNENR
jgi:hypothetical protein